MEERSCDSIATGVQQTRHRTLCAMTRLSDAYIDAQSCKIACMNGMPTLSLASQTREHDCNAVSERKAWSEGPRLRGPSGADH